jgi:hypothetical protein
MDIKNGVASIAGVNSAISCPIKRLAPGRSISCVVMGEHPARNHRVHHRPHVHRHVGGGHRNRRHRH